MRKTLSIIIATLALPLLVALAGRYVSGHWLFFTFASFQIHGAVLALAMTLLAFLLHRTWPSLIMALVAAVIGLHGYRMLDDFQQPALNNTYALPLFRLLSINIMGDNSRANGARIADYIIGSGADVVMIQESAPIGPDIDRIKVIYPYRLGCGAKTITCDSSLWSKRPLVSGEVMTASPIYRDRLMMASIDFGGTLVHFANVHLTKPYFDNMHEIELGKIAKAVEATTGPMILAGDFNASILTPDVRAFLQRTGLRTAGREPNTWPVGFEQIGAAIDHVFVRDPLHLTYVRRAEQTNGSNHYGLVAEVVLEDLTVSAPPQ